MSIKTTIQGLPYLVRRYPLYSIAWTAAATLAIGACVWSYHEGQTNPISPGLGELQASSPILFALCNGLLSAAVGVGAIGLTAMVCGFGFVCLWLLYIIFIENLLPWALLKLRSEGRRQLRADKELVRRDKLRAKAETQAANRDAHAAQRSAVHAEFLAIAEKLYQAEGLNVLESYVEARALKDQAVEESGRRARL